MIRTLAREAAAGEDGMAVSPLVNTDRKGGALPIMMQQFKRAVGVAIVRGNANHKLGRMHYVRGSAEEAAHTCNCNHSDYRYKPSERGGGQLVSRAHTRRVLNLPTIPKWTCFLHVLIFSSASKDNTLTLKF